MSYIIIIFFTLHHNIYYKRRLVLKIFDKYRINCQKYLLECSQLTEIRVFKQKNQYYYI